MVTARRRHRDSLRDSSSDSCPVHVRCGDDKAIAAAGWRSLQHQSRDHSQRQSYVDEYHPKRLHKICVWARLRGSNFRTGLDQIQGGPFRYRRASSAGYSQGATSTNASGAFGRSPQACAPSRATGALVLGARGWEGRFQATPRQQRLGRCSRADDIGPHCQHSDVDAHWRPYYRASSGRQS